MENPAHHVRLKPQVVQVAPHERSQQKREDAPPTGAEPWLLLIPPCHGRSGRPFCSGGEVSEAGSPQTRRQQARPAPTDGWASGGRVSHFGPWMSQIGPSRAW